MRGLDTTMNMPTLCQRARCWCVAGEGVMDTSAVAEVTAVTAGAVRSSS
jgi:hypothetical protein